MEPPNLSLPRKKANLVVNVAKLGAACPEIWRHRRCDEIATSYQILVKFARLHPNCQ
jgi:hypothetical protein